MKNLVVSLVSGTDAPQTQAYLYDEPQGAPYEIAGRLSISQRTVEKHIEEALRELRKLTNVSILVFIMKLF